MKLIQFLVGPATASLLIAILTGCGGPSGPERHDISGEVTFQGTPVPMGEISFDPIEQRIGGGFASIQDGKFDTTVDGRGHLGGPHKVRIVGYKGSFDPSNAEAKLDPMFEPYEVEVDLPTEKTTRDFEIPADAAP